MCHLVAITQQNYSSNKIFLTFDYKVMSYALQMPMLMVNEEGVKNDEAQKSSMCCIVSTQFIIKLLFTIKINRLLNSNNLRTSLTILVERNLNK